MDESTIRLHTYDVPLCFRARDLRFVPRSKEGLAGAIPLLKKNMTGRGFLRVQIGPDTFHKSIQTMREVNMNLLKYLTENLYEPLGTHTYDEVLCLSLYLVD
jgi:hypothetical protein